MVCAWLVAGGLGLLVGIRVLGVERGSGLALLVGALPLTLLPAYALLALALLARRRALGLAAVLLALAHLVVVTPAVGADEAPGAADGAPSLRVVTANLYVRNPDPAQAGRAMRELRPDVLVVPELGPEGLAGLQESGLLTDLPFSVHELTGRTETVGLFSRLPLEDVGFRVGEARQLPRATITVGGSRVRLVTGHPLPPVSGFEPLWRRSLAGLADDVRRTPLPVVVAGDLNADRDHAPFRDLLGTGLRDVHDARGRGLARTWPASFPVLHLDHVLVRDGAGARLVARDVREVQVPGSDHLAVVADLAVVGR